MSRTSGLTGALASLAGGVRVTSNGFREQADDTADRSVDTVVGQIQRHPEMYPVVDKELRQAVTRRSLLHLLFDRGRSGVCSVGLSCLKGSQNLARSTLTGPSAGHWAPVTDHFPRRATPFKVRRCLDNLCEWPDVRRACPRELSFFNPLPRRSPWQLSVLSGPWAFTHHRLR